MDSISRMKVNVTFPHQNFLDLIFFDDSTKRLTIVGQSGLASSGWLNNVQVKILKYTDSIFR